MEEDPNRLGTILLNFLRNLGLGKFNFISQSSGLILCAFDTIIYVFLIKGISGLLIFNNVL